MMLDEMVSEYRDLERERAELSAVYSLGLGSTLIRMSEVCARMAVLKEEIFKATLEEHGLRI